MIEPFNDWDLTRLVPRPDWTPPDELKLAELGEK